VELRELSIQCWGDANTLAQIADVALAFDRIETADRTVCRDRHRVHFGALRTVTRFSENVAVDFLPQLERARSVSPTSERLVGPFRRRIFGGGPRFSNEPRYFCAVHDNYRLAHLNSKTGLTGRHLHPAWSFTKPSKSSSDATTPNPSLSICHGAGVARSAGP